MFSPFQLVEEKKKFNRQGVLHAIDPVVNLATVNYILHGLQRFGFDSDNHKTWNTLWIALGIDEHFAGKNAFVTRKLSQEMTETQKNIEVYSDMQKREWRETMKRFYYTLKMRVLRRKLVDYLVKHVIKPFGIPRGSEKQGRFWFVYAWLSAPIFVSLFCVP